MDLLGQVDIVFVVDSTGSMAPFIQTAREEVKAILDKAEEDADLDIRVALVAYRDHPPQDSSFVVDVAPFGSTEELKAALDAMRAGGGGDTPEAVLDGLLTAATLDWRENADKSIYLVGDAPAHGVGYPGDAFEACPCRATPGGVVEVINSKGIRLNVVAIASDVLGFKDFANACRGSYAKVEVAAMAESMHFARAKVGETVSFVGATRTYAAASASLRSADHELISSHLGWSADMTEGVLAYASSRGITPEMMAEPEPSVTGKKKRSRRPV